MKTLNITSPYGQSHTYSNVVKNEYIKGINHIELSNGKKFTVNCWDGWKIVVIDRD